MVKGLLSNLRLWQVLMKNRQLKERYNPLAVKKTLFCHYFLNIFELLSVFN